MTKRIILAVSGSISAYKAADLTSRLKKKGYDVHVIMTEAAQAFITPLTLQVLSKNPVHTDVMEETLATKKFFQNQDYWLVEIRDAVP